MSGPLLVTGGTGYLGDELLRQAAGRPLAATHFRSDPGPAEAAWVRSTFATPPRSPALFSISGPRP